MNLVLLFDEDLVHANRAIIQDERRLKHIHTVLRARVGERLKVGLLNGGIGYGTLIEISAEAIQLEVTIEHAPPPPLPLTLILALPRPKKLRLTLQTVSSFCGQVVLLLHSYC